MKIFKEIIIYIIVIVVAVLVKTYIATPILVNGESMEKTLFDNDVMILNKIAYKNNEIKRFDIVVIEREDDYIIKRVIGLPGEKIKYEDNVLYVNGKKVDENFKHEKTSDFDISEIDVDIIPDNMYFVLGDNRVNSLDSRIFGLVSDKKIWGKADFVLFPFSRFGKVK